MSDMDAAVDFAVRQLAETDDEEGVFQAVRRRFASGRGDAETRADEDAFARTAVRRALQRRDGSPPTGKATFG
jgi:hypothetical protein